MAEIVIQIHPDGATEIEVNGVSGPSCKQLTEQIEKALGSVVADKKKVEWHHGSTQAQKQQVRRGM